MLHVSVHLRAARLRLGLTPQQAAARLGYANLAGGANKLLKLEAVGGNNKLARRYAAALGIGEGAFDLAVELDEKERVEARERLMSVPREPWLSARLMPGVVVNVQLPDEVVREGDDAMIAYALVYASRMCGDGGRAWLGLPDGRTACIKEGGVSISEERSMSRPGMTVSEREIPPELL